MSDDKIIIRLKSNYVSNIKPTNELRENEYENYILIPKFREAINGYNNFLLDETYDINININYSKFGFYLSIIIYNRDTIEYITEKDKNTLLKLQTNIYLAIDKLIDTLNNAAVEFVSFSSDIIDNDYFQIFDGKIYGMIYDLNKDTYVEPAKVKKIPIKFEPVDKDYVIMAIEKFVR